MNETTALEAIVKRDRAVVIFGLGIVIAASWLYTLMGAGMGMTALEMTTAPVPTAAGGNSAVVEAMSMAHDAMMHPALWSAGYALLMFFMWWVMMIAMMLPSAAPMILLFAQVNRKQKERDAPFVPTGIFAAGYLVVWGGFSLVATGLQWGLEQMGLLSPMMVGTNAVFSGCLLVVAGIYQLTPLKHACLKYCRGPIDFVMRHWRPGGRGALRMGLEHGAFCLACCWFLMVLLFVGGVMNLYWIAGLALFVLLEKLVPFGHRFGYALGVFLAVWGVWVLVP